MLKLEIISAEYVAHNFPTAFDIASNLVRVVPFPLQVDVAANLVDKRQIRKLSADVDAMFEEVDLVVMPTCVKPPPRHVPKDKGIEGIMDAGSTCSRLVNYRAIRI
jgi:Asp-tRNA(Asn)/Glu-tRNA(Gln) amidotransferase A subunit family amidase